VQQKSAERRLEGLNNAILGLSGVKIAAFFSGCHPIWASLL
jgi:hypothetical protein